MANTRVNIDVSINTSAAARNLRQLQAQINSFQSALNTNNKLQGDAAKFYSQQLRDLANQSGFFNAETIKMRTAASELDQTLSKGQGTMRQFISARFLKDSAAAAQVLSLANARAAALETQFVSTGAAAGGFREAIAIRPLQAFNSATSVATQRLAIHRAMLLQATTSMINFGKNTQWAGRQLMVGFTVPLTIFGGIAGKVFKEIETELVNFKKVYGDAFTPPEELESNIEAVKDLAKEYTKYGIAVKDTIGLAAKAAATGAQNADLIDATRESTRLATLGQMEQNQALETTIALQTAFNISGENLGKTINFLNMVENQTVVTLQDLAAAIPRVAPVIKGLGGSVEDMAVMLAAMREGGVTAAQGANALKSGLASLINPSNKAVEALGKVGINLNAIVQANRGDLMGTVQAFAQALSTLDEFGQQQALEKVFGKFQYARLGALFKNIIKDGSQASRVMDTAAMSAQELAASAEKELGAIEQATSVKFTAAMEKLKLSIAPIGEMFMKIAIPIINFFTQLAEKFNNLPDVAKKFAAFGAIMIGLVIPTGTMFLGLLMNLTGTLIKFGSIVGIAFKGFVTGGIRGAIESVSQALNYMSLAELDASNASRQLGTSTEIVNAALRDQVPAAAGADAAIDNLSRSYAILIAQMQQAAALSRVAFVGPGAAMAGAAATGAEAGRRSSPRGPRLRRNMGGTIPGSGNTDTVPAMLTPGEFVINKEATAKNLPLLHSINEGENIPGFNKGGQIPGMQYFASKNKIRVVQDLMDDWSQDTATFAGMFGTSRTRSAKPNTQRKINAAKMESEDVYRSLIAQYEEGFETAKVSALRIAVEKLGISPKDLGLSTRGNYTFRMSEKSNADMMRGTLQRDRLIEDLSAPDVYDPLQRQVGSYFGTGLDKVSFDNILRSEFAMLPESGITNKLFEKASRNALTKYLNQAGFTREQRKSFTRDILAKDAVSANLSKPQLLQALQKHGIPYRQGESKKDIYATIDGKEVNMGYLLGREVGSLGSRPQGILSFKSLSGSGQAVHANKGGQIPGMQYFAAKEKQRVVQSAKPVKPHSMHLTRAEDLSQHPLIAKALAEYGENAIFVAQGAGLGTSAAGPDIVNNQMQGVWGAQKSKDLAKELNLPERLWGDKIPLTDGDAGILKSFYTEYGIRNKNVNLEETIKFLEPEGYSDRIKQAIAVANAKAVSSRGGGISEETYKEELKRVEKAFAGKKSAIGIQNGLIREFIINKEGDFRSNLPAFVIQGNEEAATRISLQNKTTKDFKPRKLERSGRPKETRPALYEARSSARYGGGRWGGLSNTLRQIIGLESGGMIPGYNIGGIVSDPVQQMFLGGVAGAANAARGGRGRIPGNVVDWFSKITTSINQSSRDDLLQNIPANIKKALSTSKKKFDITRGSIDPIDGGDLKRVSSWSTGQGVGRFMESSRVFETLQNSKFQIAQRSQGMKRAIDMLKDLGPDGPGPGKPYSPFNRKDGGILNTNLTQKDIQEAGGSVWKANKKKVEERILRDQEFISGHQKIIDDLQESYIPTIYRTSVRRGEKYFDVSDRIVPKDAQRLNNPAASTDILEEKEVALLGAKLSGTPTTRIVEKAEAQMRYDKASEEIKKLRMAIFKKEISAEEAKPMLQRLYDESENMASFVNWGRGREVSYPKVISRNMGGIIPDVQHLMAGALVKSKVATKTKAPTKAPLETAQDWAMSGSDPDWDLSPAVMDFLSKRVKPTKSSSAEIKFLQKRGIDTKGMEASSMADRWKPKGKTAKDILETQYEVNVEEGIPLIAQALKRGATDEEMVASILAAQQWHSYAKSSPKELKEMFKTFSPSQIQDLTNGLMSLPENHQLRSTLTGIFPEIKLMQEGIGGYKDADLQKAFFALSSMNKGGMIPGIQHLMAGAKVMPYVRPKKPAGPRATELEKEVMKKRAAASVAQDKALDDLIFRRGKDGKLNLTPSELLVLLRENPNISEKQFKEISKYHGSRIKTGMFGHFDKERGYRVVDQSAGTWRNISKVLEERGYPVVQKRNIGGEIFDSTKTSRTIVPGVGNTDTVPAMLTPGEFVINKDATNKNLDILHAINSGQPIGLNIGGKVPAIQHLMAGAKVMPVDDWGAPIDNPFADLDTPATSQFDDWGAPVNQKKPSRLERFKSGVRSTARDVRMVGSDDFDETDTGKKINESKPGKYLNRRLAAGERAGAILAKISEIEFQKERTGIKLNENLAKYAELKPGKMTKEANLKIAERLIAEYDAEFAKWVANGRRPPAITTTQPSGTQTSAYRMDPTIVGRRDVYGYDSNGKPVTDGYKARLMQNSKSLYDANGTPIETDGRPIAYEIDKKTGATVFKPQSVAEKARFALTRRQKIWAAIAGTAITGTAAGIAINERAKATKDPLALNLGGTANGSGNTDTVPAMLTPGEFVINKKATQENLELLHAINSGKALGFNKGGRVPLTQYFTEGGGPVTTTTVPANQGFEGRQGTKPLPVEITDVTGKAKKGLNAKAIGRGAAGVGMGIGLGTAGFFAGSAVGEKIGGETGAMVGGIAGSMLPMLLPRTIKGLPTGGMLPAMGGKKPPVDGAAQILKTSTVAKPAENLGSSMKDTATKLGKFSFNIGRFARIVPLLLNPWTALAAAVVAVTYTLYQLHKSNQAEYEMGRKFADAISTTSDEIALLGETAKQRAKNMDNYLDQSESSFMETKFNKRIAAAKTEREKIALKREKEEAMKAAGGKVNRRARLETFYDSKISERGLTTEQRINAYEQRNMALSAKRGEGLNVDTTFGKQFIQGKGKDIFEEFKSLRDLSLKGGANINLAGSLSGAAYGSGTSIADGAAKEMADKLSQYILSGVMTEDEAASVAQVMSQELKDAKIGETIRKQVLSNVGADGLKAKYDPGSVALKLAEKDERKMQEIRGSLEVLQKQMYGPGTSVGEGLAANILMGGSVTGIIGGQIFKDLLSASRKDDKKNQNTPIAMQQEMFFPSFFSGMGDEMRRQIGATIELQTSQMQMLEENIAAVGLAYNDLIMKAGTLQEKQDLEVEKSLAIQKLQEKADKAREDSLSAFGGSDQYVEIVQKQQQELRDSFRRNAEVGGNIQREEFGKALQADFDWGNLSKLGTNLSNFANIGWEGITLGLSNVGETIFNGAFAIGSALDNTMLDPTGMGTYGETLTVKTFDQILKKFEGSSLVASLEALQETESFGLGVGTDDISWLNTFQNILVKGEAWGQTVIDSLITANAAITSMTLAANPVSGTLNAGEAQNLREDVGLVSKGFTLQGNQMLTPEGQTEMTNFITSFSQDLMNGGDNLQRAIDMLNNSMFFNGEQAAVATERWATFWNDMGSFATVSMRDGRDLYDIYSEDPVLIDLILTDDEFYKGYQKFTTWLNKQDEKTRLTVQFEMQESGDPVKYINGIIKSINNFDEKKANKKFKSLQKSFKDLGKSVPPEMESEIGRISRAFNSLNKIKDPKLKAELLAEIDPNIDLLIEKLRQLGLNPGDVELQNDVLDLSTSIASTVSSKVREAKDADTKKDTDTSGGGGQKEDPLGDIFRSLRNKIDVQANFGEIITATGQKAKGIFDRLRKIGLNESIIDVFKSLDPAVALDVGKQVLNSRKKLNTLISLMSQNVITAAREAAKAAQGNAKFISQAASNAVFSGMSSINVGALFEDENFMTELQTAVAGAENKQKAARKFIKSYLARMKAERKQDIAMAPAKLNAEAGSNMVFNQGTNMLASGLNLTQEQASSAMGNDQINLIISELMRGGKQIEDLSAKQRSSILNWVNSQKTVVGEFSRIIDKVKQGFMAVEASISGAINKIQLVNIDPLEDKMRKYTDQNAEWSEQTRRLSQSMSDLQEKENDLKEKQRKKEEAINESYDLRIESLEKIDRISKQIEDRQKGQISVADALSRGDIGAAAKAAQEMQSKFAQAKRDEALQAMRDQKQEDIENLKKSNEEELKNLTVNVNGELLTREQIEQRIKKIDDLAYAQSLLEYDLQKQITKELRDQEKLSKTLTKVQAINSVLDTATVATTQDSGLRADEISQMVAQLEVIPTQEALALKNWLISNLDSLNVMDPTSFAEAIAPQLSSFVSTSGAGIGTDLSSLANLLQPSLLSAAKEGLNNAVPETPLGLSAELDAFVRKWEDKNPFSLVEKGFNKWKDSVIDAFAKFPTTIGQGGGNNPGDPPPPPPPPPPGSPRIPTRVEVEKGTVTMSKIETKNGVTYRVTKFYSKSNGQEIPELIKYDVVKKKQIGMAGGRPDYSYNTVAEHVQLGLTADTAETRLQGVGLYPLPSQYGSYATPQSGGRSYPVGTKLRGEPVAPPFIPGGMGDPGKSANNLGKDVAMGTEQGAVDYFNTPEFKAMMGNTVVEATAESVGARSPATKMFPVGGFIAEGLIKGAILWLASPVISLWNSLSSLFNKETGTEKGASTKTGSIGENLISGLFNGVLAMLVPEQIRTFLSSGFNSLMNGIKSLLGISESTVDSKDSPKGMGKKSAGEILSGFVSGLLPENITAFIKNPIGTFLTTIGGLLGITEKTMKNDGAPLSIGKKVVGFLLDGVGEMLGIKNLSTKISEHFENFKTAINNFFFGEGGDKDSKSSWVYQVGKNALDAIVSGFKSVDLGAAFRTAISAAKASLPGPVQTVLTGLGWYYGGEVKRAFGGKINYRGSTESAPGMMMGGSVKKFAFGSFVPGRGMTDKVPALLTPGEFVVRKSVAQTMLPQLKALNSQVYPGAGIDKQKPMTYSSSQFEKTKSLNLESVRFPSPQNMNSFMQSTPSILANNSNPSSPAILSSNSSGNVQYTYNVNVSAGSNASPDDIANKVMYKIKRFDDRKIKGTQIG